MDLFGIKEHDERHDEVEHQLRRLVEQVAELSIDLSVTRAELRALTNEVEGKVSTDEVDPTIIGLNEGIKQARIKLKETQDAADEEWNRINDELAASVDELRSQLEDASPGEAEG